MKSTPYWPALTEDSLQPEAEEGDEEDSATERALRPRLMGNDPNTSVFISLFMILVAFFLMLNQLSNLHAVRSGQTMESVGRSFSRADRPASAAIGGRPGLLAMPDPIQENLKAVFRSTLPLARFEVAGKGNIFNVTVDAARLFDDAGNLKTTREALFGRVADILRKRKDLTLTLQQPQRTADEDRLPTYRRAGVLLADLERRGAPPQRMRAGFAALKEGRIRLSFHLPATEGAAGAPMRLDNLQ